MADQRNGGISWSDETWNFLRGCRRKSTGCLNCYAEIARRIVDRVEARDQREKRLVLLEVLGEYRIGRGRWWRPNAGGYTDNLAEAGLFVAGSELFEDEPQRAVEREPDELLVEEATRLEEEIRVRRSRLEKIRILCMQVVGSHPLPSSR